jgi:hypothetical protein
MRQTAKVCTFFTLSSCVSAVTLSVTRSPDDPIARDGESTVAATVDRRYKLMADG